MLKWSRKGLEGPWLHSSSIFCASFTSVLPSAPSEHIWATSAMWWHKYTQTLSPPWSNGHSQKFPAAKESDEMEHTLIGFRRSSNSTQKQIKAMQGNCKIYCSKLNYGILVKHNILNFFGSIIGLLNYNCGQGMMWNTLAPILQISKSGTTQRDEGWDVFSGDGYKDTHHLGSHLTDVCLLPPSSWWI